MPRLPVARDYTILEVKKRHVPFSYWPVVKMSQRMALQSTLFSTDPWAIMRQAIRSSTTAARDEALALLEQAQDYYRAATSAAVAASKPVLLYYCYLNTAKAFLLHRGKRTTYEKAQHGLSEQLGAGGRELLDASLEAHRSTITTSGIIKINVFDDFLAEIRGTGLTTNTTFELVNIMPQIVPGHRLWVVASNGSERFISIDRIELARGIDSNNMWLNVVLDNADLTRLDYGHGKCLQESGLRPGWRNVRLPDGFVPQNGVLFEQVTTTAYGRHPSQELLDLVATIRLHLWSTILSAPPYRRYYLYLCPAAEQAKPCVPQ